MQEMNMGPKTRKQDKYEAEQMKTMQEKQEECQTRKAKGREQFQAKSNRKNVRPKARGHEEWQAKIKRAGRMAG